MKKILQLLCVSLFFIPNFALGQDKPFLDPSEIKSNKVIVSYGVNIGLNFPGYYGGLFGEALPYNAGPRPAGVLISFVISSKISDDLNFNLVNSFIRKGSDFRGFVSEEKIFYIDVAPMVSYNFIDKLSINFGPYLGFLVYSDFIEIYGDSYSYYEEYDPPSLEFRRIDYGLNSSISYIVFKNISINIGYSLGLKKISKQVWRYEDREKESDLLPEKNQGMYFSVGYSFK